jgi:hypothetical protein
MNLDYDYEFTTLLTSDRKIDIRTFEAALNSIKDFRNTHGELICSVVLKDKQITIGTDSVASKNYLEAIKQAVQKQLQYHDYELS